MTSRRPRCWLLLCSDILEDIETWSLRSGTRRWCRTCCNLESPAVSGLGRFLPSYERRKEQHAVRILGDILHCCWLFPLFWSSISATVNGLYVCGNRQARLFCMIETSREGIQKPETRYATSRKWQTSVWAARPD